jgi:hypothetical protein
MIIGSTVCGPNTVSEAGVVNLICCTGFDDAGAPTGEL